MDIQKYEALIKAVEHGSLTKAAELLGYTQSGISHMVNTIEEEWKLKIIYRDRSGARLTPEGEALMPAIRQVCHANSDLLQQIAMLHGLEIGTISIACINSVSGSLLPGMIKTYNAAHPNIKLKLFHGDYSETENWVAEGKVEFAITMLPSQRGLQSIHLFQDRLLALLPVDYPHKSDVFHIDDMAGVPFIDHNSKHGSSQLLHEHLTAAGIQPDIRFTAKDDHSLMSMVECGLGISILSELFLREKRYRLVVKEIEPPLYRDIGVVYKGRGQLSLAAASFIEHLVQSCR